MISSEAQRKLVKSPPELWAELSDAAALGRHLGELGEIRITSTEPERSVEWEAEAAKGKVELKPSGWGTQVTLTVTRELPEAEPEPPPEPVSQSTPEPVSQSAPEPPSQPASEPESRQGFFARLFKRRPKPAPEPPPEPPDAQEPSAEEIAQLEAAKVAELAAAEQALAAQTTELLNDVLDRLGAAHHRPFSRA